MRTASPVSVLISGALRVRLKREAARRSLKLSTVLRALADERLCELDEREGLTLAEQWQRTEAWAAWTAHQSGENPEVEWKTVDARFQDADAGTSASRPPRGSRKTSKRKSRC